MALLVVLLPDAPGTGWAALLAAAGLCIGGGALTARTRAASLFLVPFVLLLPWAISESDSLWPVAVTFMIAALVAAVLLTLVGVAFGKGPRPVWGTAAGLSIAAVLGGAAWMTVAGVSWNQRTRVSPEVAARLEAAGDAFFLCFDHPGSRGPRPTPGQRRQYRADLRFLVQEAETHPDWLMKRTRHDSDSGAPFDEEISVRDRAREVLGSLAPGSCPEVRDKLTPVT